MIAPRAGFLFEDDVFDVVFATLMFEYVENSPHTIGEMVRVCCLFCVMALSFPFLCNEQDMPNDFDTSFRTVHHACYSLRLMFWNVRAPAVARE